MLPSMKTQADVAAMIFKAIQKEHENLRVEDTSQITDAIANYILPQVDSFFRNYMSNNILYVHPTQTAKANARELYYQLYLTMKDDEQLQNEDLSIWLPVKIKFEKITTAIVYEFDAWMEDVGTDDVKVHAEEASQELLEEMSKEIDKAKLQKAVDEMLRQRCNSGEEHQYHNIWENKFHIRRKKEKRDKPEEVYSNSKIDEVIGTTYELGHEHKFIIELIVRRANENIDSIKEPNYKETGLLGSLRISRHGELSAEYLRYYKEDIEDRLKHQD
ncbi:hypothetical protein Tco_0933733 [Tanacetum coccineum]